MFESLFGDLITRFLGHFLDVKTDQLRVSLWSGTHQMRAELAHVKLNVTSNQCSDPIV